MKAMILYANAGNGHRRSAEALAGLGHQAFRIGIDSMPDGVDTTDMGWQIWPEGLSKIIHAVCARHRKPIYITENGIADANLNRHPAEVSRWRHL